MRLWLYRRSIRRGDLARSSRRGSRFNFHRELAPKAVQLTDPSLGEDSKLGAKMINGPAETVGEKPAYRGLLNKHPRGDRVLSLP